MSGQVLASMPVCAACLAIALALGLPLLAGVLVVIRPRIARDALAVSALPLLLVVLLLEPGEVHGASALVLGARFGADAWTLPMLILCALVWTAAGIALPAYAGEAATIRLAPWWLLALAGNAGLVLALDPVSFFVFFALMSFAAYAMVVERGDPAARFAARRYMVFVVIGEIALLNALVLSPDEQGVAKTVLMVVGFGVKAALLGLHPWLPLAHTAAPAPASAVLSGSMIAAGVLGWLRFLDPAPLPGLGDVIAVLGIASVLYATLLGLLQSAPKAVLAYSSVAQMGLVAVAIGAHLNGYTGAGVLAAWYALHHGLAKAALFLAVPLIEGARGKLRRVLLGVSLLPAAAIIGLPLTSGGALKVELKSAAAGGLDAWLAAPMGILLGVGAVGSTLLMARLLRVLARGGPGAGGVPPGLAAGWLALVVAGTVVALLQPFAATSAVAGTLTPFLWGIAIAALAMAAAGAGLIPVLTPRTADPTRPTALVQPLRVHMAAGLALARADDAGRRAVAQAWARLAETLDRTCERLEAAARRWITPGVALMGVVLITVLAQVA